jgi:hypothetical protein
VSINPSNAKKQYNLATRLLRTLSLSLIVVFIILEINTVTIALNPTNEQKSAWLLPVILLLVLSPMGFYIVKMLISRSSNT